MPVPKANIRATAKYNKKAYDELKVRVKKGQKAVIQEYVQAKGLSLNGYIVKLIEDDMNK